MNVVVAFCLGLVITIIITSPSADAWLYDDSHSRFHFAKQHQKTFHALRPDNNNNKRISPLLAQKQDYFVKKRNPSSLYLSQQFARTVLPSCRTTPTTLYAASSSSSSSSSWTEIPTIQGPFDAKSFAETNCWGQQPLLLQQSFLQSSLLFSWEDICELALNEDEESITSRLITHEPGTLDTFRLHFGPFSETELHGFVVDTSSSPSAEHEEKGASSTTVSTLVLNDVDRWIPSLSDWMDQQFGFLPRWRRDDAQVSLARVGGGIGPHVDNYDVFLIQVSGTRTWKIGLESLSVKDEFENLVEASEVRVLDLDELSVGGGEFILTIELGPGDCLYLPPRVVHWGSSTSNDCMTLSVGCRAPSASELLQRVTESITDSFIPSALATARYTDDMEDIRAWSSSSIQQQDGNQSTSRDLSKKVKDKMKRLVLDLVEEQLEDHAMWDGLVGEIVTEPNRPTIDYPLPLSDMEPEWKAELGIWANAEQTLEAVLNGNGVLRRAEGISFAWSGSTGDSVKKSFTLFAQGRSFRLNDKDNDDSHSAPRLLDMIANSLPLGQKQLVEQKIELTETMKDFLRDLLEEGLLYGDNEDEEEERK